MAERTEHVQLITIETNTDSLKTLKQEIKESTVEMNKLANGLRLAEEQAEKIGKSKGLDSEEFKKAVAEVEKFKNALTQSAKEVAELKDKMDDVADQVNSFHPDKKFQGLALAANMGATALQGVAGAMTAVGVESDTAAETMARLQGIMAFTQAIKDVKGLQGEWEAFTSKSKAAKTALEAQKKAQEGATVATKGFGTAFKAIGIGLVIAAIAALVENWDKVKKVVTDTFPALKDMSGLFDKLKQVAFGVGNVLLQHIVAPIKAIVKAIQGDFKGAVQEFKNGVDVVKNYQAGANAELERQKEDQHKDALQKEIERNQDIIEVMKARGQDTYNQEKKQFERKRELVKDDQDKLKELNQEEKVLDASHAKQMQDQRKAANDKAQQQREQHNEKMKQLLEAERETLKKHEEEISNIIDEGTKNVAKSKLDAKSKELFDSNDQFNKERKIVQDNYNEDLKILQDQLKRKVITTEQFNTKVLDLNSKSEQANGVLMEQKNIRDFEITKKYNKQISDFLDGYNKTEYEKRRAKIVEEFDNLIKVADEAQKKALEDAKNKALNNADRGEDARKFSVTQETNYVNTVTNNMPNEADTVDVALAKEDAIYQALKAKKDAQFQEQLLKLGEDEEAIALLKAQYRLQDEVDEQAHTDKKKEIWEREAQAKHELEMLKMQAVATAFGIAEQFAGKNKKLADTMFILQKAMAIAEVVVNTQKEIAGYWANPTWKLSPDGGVAMATAMSAKAKIRAGISIATIAAASIAKFMSKANSGGESDAPQIQQAPQINATNLNVQPVEVRATNQPDQIIKAYITDKDLKDNEAKSNFLNKLGSI
jgi:myosin heavy subunit